MALGQHLGVHILQEPWIGEQGPRVRSHDGKLGFNPGESDLLRRWLVKGEVTAKDLWRTGPGSSAPWWSAGLLHWAHNVRKRSQGLRKQLRYHGGSWTRWRDRVSGLRTRGNAQSSVWHSCYHREASTQAEVGTCTAPLSAGSGSWPLGQAQLRSCLCSYSASTWLLQPGPFLVPVAKIVGSRDKGPPGTSSPLEPGPAPQDQVTQHHRNLFIWQIQLNKSFST